MNIKGISLGALGTNCYIVYDDVNCLIVDPGGEPEKVIELIVKLQVKPQAILLTHAHFDHIGAVDELRNHFNLDVYLHEAESDWLSDPNLNGSILFTRTPVTTKAPDKILKTGKMDLSSFSFEVIHTPGHSPGSVTFVFETEKFIISGDVLFQQGVGRTDLPGGNSNELVNSIRNKLYQLDESYIIYPGHGSQTNIQAEKKLNPYVPGY